MSGFCHADFFLRIPSCMLVPLCAVHCAFYGAGSIMQILLPRFHRAHSIVWIPSGGFYHADYRADSILQILSCKYHPIGRIPSCKFHCAVTVERIPLSEIHLIMWIPSCRFYRARNAHDGLHTMEYVRWNPHNRFHTMKPAPWNPHDNPHNRILYAFHRVRFIACIPSCDRRRREEVNRYRNQPILQSTLRERYVVSLEEPVAQPREAASSVQPLSMWRQGAGR